VLLMLGMVAGVYTAVASMPGMTADGQKWVEQHRQAGALVTALAGALDGAVQGAVESLRVAAREMVRQLTGTVTSLVQQLAKIAGASPAGVVHVGQVLMAP
jgi:hypothetical protein